MTRALRQVPDPVGHGFLSPPPPSPPFAIFAMIHLSSLSALSAMSSDIHAAGLVDTICVGGSDCDAVILQELWRARWRGPLSAHDFSSYPSSRGPGVQLSASIVRVSSLSAPVFALIQSRSACELLGGHCGTRRDGGPRICRGRPTGVCERGRSVALHGQEGRGRLQGPRASEAR